MTDGEMLKGAVCCNLSVSFYNVNKSLCPLHFIFKIIIFTCSASCELAIYDHTMILCTGQRELTINIILPKLGLLLLP